MLLTGLSRTCVGSGLLAKHDVRDVGAIERDVGHIRPNEYGAGEGCAREISAVKHGSLQLGPREVGSAELSVAEISISEGCALEVGVSEGGMSQI